ncbi:LysM domain-containing protein [Curtobacterium sp. MCBD17_013]|uniref:LysM peptidoglycan-binding domain-containing protein n=1 Tax=Curtobacterium sp. MCBD17_013 TaxID=2175668 RepID=UPI0021AC224C|nr:LysM domain-containing protein [Curtobacterium sp. MCBD17_013]
MSRWGDRDGVGAEQSGTPTVRVIGVVVAVATAGLLTGCSMLGGTTDPGPSVTTSHRPTHHRMATVSATPTATPTAPSAGVIPGSATPRPATAGPEAAPSPSPTLTSVPQGTVVAQGDVASPKGSVHFHYRMVANGDDTYSAEYSGFTSTVPVPISVTLLDVPPEVGDGLTYHGVADHQLGGPTTTPAPASSASLGDIGQPAYLGTLVTYSSAAAEADVPQELGPDKVLAVDTVHWSIPVRQSNVHPVDGGARPYASGTVTATTASGAPKRYRVAHGDTTAMVASRFGISVQDLIWLNAGLQVFGDQQYLYEDTTINLDPDSK